MQGDQNIIDSISERLERDVPEWLGQEVRQLRQDTPMITRPLSYTIRYFLELENGKQIKLRLKIRRERDTPSLEAATQDPILRRYSRREYEVLKAMHEVVSQQHNPALCAIRVFGYLPDFSATVMEELPSRNLDEWMLDLRMRIGVSSYRQHITDSLLGAGQLLSLYHNQVGGAAIEPFDGSQMAERVQKCLQKCKHSYKLLDPYKVEKKLFKAIDQLDQQPVLHAPQHRDFTFKNIVTTDDNRIALLDMDPKFFDQRQPIYLDIAQLIVDMLTQKVKLRSFGYIMPVPFLERCEQILLKGYFNGQPYDKCFLGLFKAVGMLDALNWYDNRVNSLEGTTGKISKKLFPLVQSYLVKGAVENTCVAIKKGN
jgi:hypothetical protein